MVEIGSGSRSGLSQILGQLGRRLGLGLGSTLGRRQCWDYDQGQD